ncbi:MAG TPA: enoyl-CoA hydratase/isomerase family protein [Acidimicrobiales bacterium]
MEAMHATTLEVGAEGPRGWITLARPDKLNPLGTATLLELVEAARWCDARPDLKVVVVSGQGRAFSAGADLAAFGGAGDAAAAGEDDAGTAAGEPADPREAADAGRRAADALEAMRAVTVARIHGHCVGGAVVLAAACDLRVAAASTRFAIPEVDLGIPLAWGGIPRLVREIGPALTKELVMTCRPFGADEAKAAGFLNRVVPDEDLDREVDDLVAQLVGKPALALDVTKRHVGAVADGTVATARAFADADTLVTALHDPESRAVSARYLAGRRRR